MSTNNTLHVVITSAHLLSGSRLQDCRNATDPTCQSGVAAVDAFARRLEDPTLILPVADLHSPFVQMHPLNWNVNRLVLNELLQWPVFTADHFILTQTTTDRDLTGLQTQKFPLTITNVAVPPTNAWAHYSQHIYLDAATHIALLCIVDDGELYNVPQITAAKALLDHVHRINQESGCEPASDAYDEFIRNSNFSTTTQDTTATCWTPIIYYDTSNSGSIRPFSVFLDGIVQHEYPPALVVDVAGGSQDRFSTPTLLQQRIWALSHRMTPNDYYRLQVTLSDNARYFVNVEHVVQPLDQLPQEFRDDAYDTNVQQLWQQAQLAAQNDPIVGYTTFMPVNRVDDYRRCKAGECEIGNLLTDAYRWTAKSDFSFTNSGGFRGAGWPEGPVRVSNIWDSWPFSNTLCKGTMMGISLFELMSFSISQATFEGSTTALAGDMLQVSGVRITYNTLLPQDGERIVGLDIWNDTSSKYEPVQRLQLYTFATDSFNCAANGQYPRLTGSDLFLPGEVPGFIHNAPTSQEMVINFLSKHNGIYNASIDGRLVNNTNVFEPLSLVQTKADCGLITFWEPTLQSCVSCPNISQKILFEVPSMEFSGIKGSVEAVESENILVNNMDIAILLRPRIRPSFFEYRSGSIHADTLTWRLRPGETLNLPFQISTKLLEAGTAQGSVSLMVIPENIYAECDFGDVGFDIFLRIQNSENLNLLGSYNIFGYVIASFVILAAVLCAIWTTKHRNVGVVRSLQPVFLITICLGVCIMAGTIIPLGLDDGVLSSSGSDAACMSVPWFLGLGCSITFSALFSKLWRINKIIHSGERLQRKRVREQDVLGPFFAIFLLNFAFLLAWTIVDPLRWRRNTVPDEAWNTYGLCETGKKGMTFMVLVVSINAVALISTLWQAYQARDISDEFSEGKKLAVAVFSWMQLLIVGTPVLILIDRDEPRVRYILQILLIFAVCMTMLLIIFVPTIIQARRSRRELVDPPSRTVVSGLVLSDGESSIQFAPFYQDQRSAHSITRAASHSSREQITSNVEESARSNHRHAPSIDHSTFENIEGDV